MNEIKDILVGIDFGKAESQICYYDRKTAEPLSVSVKVGTSQYEFPTCICRRKDREEWHFGREALFFAREHEGILVDNLYELCSGTDALTIEGRQMEPWELMAIFLEEALKSIGMHQPVRNTKCLVITVDHLMGEMVFNLKKACSHLGLTEGRYLLQDYSESFYYYAMAQKAECISRNVAWYAFTEGSVSFRKLDITPGSKPTLVHLSKVVTQELDQDPDMRDMQFYRFIQECMGADLYSSVFLTGNGFDQQWAVKSVGLLCKKQRKVFYGTNLFAKGACYMAKEKLEDKRLKGYLYAGDALVKVNIGMEMIIRGSSAYYPLIQAGNNWYECRKEVELILDDKQDLVFLISSIDNSQKRRVSMPLEGLPQRPNKTTRLRMVLEFESDCDCRIKIEDLGFGEWYPSSHKVWTELVKW